jgi:hypothetical protein
MYITAHRVRNAAGLEGVNSFAHLHNDNSWPVDASKMPEENPGVLATQRIEVPPGGNTIISYLDVLAPDGWPWEQVDQALTGLWLELNLRESVQSPLLSAVPNPAVYKTGAVTLRFGVRPGLEGARAACCEELSASVRQIAGELGLPRKSEVGMRAAG